MSVINSSAIRISISTHSFISWICALLSKTAYLNGTCLADWMQSMIDARKSKQSLSHFFGEQFQCIWTLEGSCTAKQPNATELPKQDPPNKHKFFDKIQFDSIWLDFTFGYFSCINHSWKEMENSHEFIYLFTSHRALWFSKCQIKVIGNWESISKSEKWKTCCCYSLKPIIW